MTIDACVLTVILKSSSRDVFLEALNFQEVCRLVRLNKKVRGLLINSPYFLNWLEPRLQALQTEYVRHYWSTQSWDIQPNAVDKLRADFIRVDRFPIFLGFFRTHYCETDGVFFVTRSSRKFAGTTIWAGINQLMSGGTYSLRPVFGIMRPICRNGFLCKQCGWFMIAHHAESFFTFRVIKRRLICTRPFYEPGPLECEARYWAERPGSTIYCVNVSQRQAENRL